MPRGPQGSGARDRWITIQQSPEPDATGSSGFPVETWTDLTQLYAAKSDVRGTERFIAHQLSAPYETRWEIPWMDDMDPDVIDVPKRRRLVVESRVHDIVAAAEVGRRQAIELLTVAGGLLT